MRRTLLSPALLAGGALTLLPGPAAALNVRSAEVTHRPDFTGTACGETVSVLATVPAGTRPTGAFAPALGTVFNNTGNGRPVARLVGAQREARGVRFTVQGSDDVCANPRSYPDGWETDYVPLTVRFSGRARVHLGYDIDDRAVFKPRLIVYRGRTPVRRVRWSAYNGRVAKGRGRVGGYPVSVRASRPRLCQREYQYTRLRVTYLGARPRGAPRTRSDYFGEDCRSDAG